MLNILALFGLGNRAASKISTSFVLSLSVSAPVKLLKKPFTSSFFITTVKTQLQFLSGFKHREEEAEEEEEEEENSLLI